MSKVTSGTEQNRLEYNRREMNQAELTQHEMGKPNSEGKQCGRVSAMEKKQKQQGMKQTREDDMEQYKGDQGKMLGQ